MDPGPISIMLLSPVYYTRTVYFTRILLSLSTRYAHNLCFKQTGEVDNLIVSWEQSIWLCVCRCRVAASKQSLDEAPYINCPKLSWSLQSITFSRLSLLSWTINLGFLTEGKSCCYIRHTFLLGFPMGWSSTMHQAYFLAPLPGIAEE